MEKTMRDIPKIVKPPDMKEQQKVKYDFEFSCKTCFHSYAQEIRPGTIGRVCQHSPPNFQLVQMPGGMGAQLVPRMVPDEYFCHQHVPVNFVTRENIKVPV